MFRRESRDRAAAMMNDVAGAEDAGFDCRSLEPEARAVALEAAAKIRLHAGRVREGVVAIGRELPRVREAMKAEFGWKRSSA